MNRHFLVNRRRGAAVDTAMWIFPVLIVLSVLLPLPLFVLTGLLCVSLVVRPRAGPAARPDLRTPFLRSLNPRGPPL